MDATNGSGRGGHGFGRSFGVPDHSRLAFGQPPLPRGGDTIEPSSARLRLPPPPGTAQNILKRIVALVAAYSKMRSEVEGQVNSPVQGRVHVEGSSIEIGGECIRLTRVKPLGDFQIFAGAAGNLVLSVKFVSRQPAYRLPNVRWSPHPFTNVRGVGAAHSFERCARREPFPGE